MESLSSRLTFLRTRLSERWHETRPVLRVVAIGIPALAILLAVAWSRCLFMGCPDVHRLASYQPGGASVLVDRNGKPFADLAPVEGELIRLPTLPTHVPEAFIAVEDQRFRDHEAIDLRRVLGAVWNNVRAGGVQEGSSTLTMQLARNVFPEDLPGQERTLGRKILEVRVAQEIEDTFTKDEILEMYLNHIYFGNGARGIEAAARHYFGRGARDLTLPQAALLAAMPKAPSHYDPRRHPKEARERRDLVLSLMAEQKRITPAEKDEAVKASLGAVPKPRAQNPTLRSPPTSSRRSGASWKTASATTSTRTSCACTPPSIPRPRRRRRRSSSASCARSRAARWAPSRGRATPRTSRSRTTARRRTCKARWWRWTRPPATCWPGSAAATSCTRASIA
jgi:membrane peptidoglycan carboxypeptidase